MRKIYGTDFVSQSVVILTPVLVFLGPFVAVSVAMQWDFTTKESFDLFYGFFYGGVIWFLVCVAACLCTAMPVQRSTSVSGEGESFWINSRKFLRFFSMFLVVTISLMLTHRFDLAVKKDRYEAVHNKICQADLSMPLEKLMRTHEVYGQPDQKHWTSKNLKDVYEESLNTVAAWTYTSRWDITVIFEETDSFTILNSTTDFLPVKKKIVHDISGLDRLAEPQTASICDMVSVGGRWGSLRKFKYENQRPVFILVRAKVGRNLY